MAVQFPTTAAFYSRTTNLPGTVWTWGSWIYVSATTVQSFFSYAGATNPVNLGMRGFAEQFKLTGGGSDSNGTTLIVGTWYHAAIVHNGTAGTNLFAYLNGVLDLSVAAGDPGTPSIIRLGLNNFGDGFSGGMHASKLYTAALTAAELQQEMRSTMPSRTANLNGWSPFLVAEATDYSGNGNAWTVNGTPITVDGPPVPWRQGRARVIYVPAGGGGGTIASGDGASLSQSTAVGAGSAVAAGDGKSAGGSAAFATGFAIVARNGASLSVGVATAPPASIASSLGQSTSVSRAAAAGAAVAAGVGFSLGLSTASGTASSATLASGDGFSRAHSAAYAIGSAIAAGNGCAPSVTFARGAGASIAAGAGVSRSESFAFAAGGSFVLGVGRSLSVSFARGSSDQLTIVFPVTPPRYIDFDALATSIDFDDARTLIIFLTPDGVEAMGPLKLFEGEVREIAMTLRGAGGVAQDLTGALSIKWSVRDPAAASPIVNAADLTPVGSPTSGRVKYVPATPMAALGAGGRFKSLAVVTFPGTPNVVVKFPGEVLIETAIV